MGFHKRHNVGRAFHGEEAREQMMIHKRDSHGNKLVMHVPDLVRAQARPADAGGLMNKQVETAEDVQTAVQVVYVTLPQTFDGSASYMTVTDDPTSTPIAVAAQPTAATTDSDQASYAAAKSAATAVTSATSAAVLAASASSSIVSSADIAASSIAAHVIGTPSEETAGPGRVAGSPLSATRGAISETSNGMSGGAKAGLAIGIILAIGLAFGLLFFCWRRKKNAQNQEESLNEKHASFADAGARRVEAESNNGTHYNNARASVLSDASEKVPASIRSTRTTSTAPRLSLRPVTQFLPTFGANAMSEKPKSAWERQPANAGENPFADASVLSEKHANPANPFDEPEGKTAASQHTPKSSWGSNEPPTPKSTKFGTAAAVAVGGSASPPPGPNNVHRVQLDFKPSMEDEIELRSGQLVRMLHEYDDGWALCIRMDRSQQGVAPRTCLSKMPVKPRPQGPPPQQGSRPGTAGSNHSSPSGAMVPRPLTPQTSGSSNGSALEGGAVPARKPVPGMAM